MSFLDVPGVKAGALDASIQAKIEDTGSATRGALNSTYVSFGPTSPAASLPPGTEYVWNKTDGAGTLLDILTGVA